MEAFALYLLKSVAWLTGFTLVFILFLRNERFFLLTRIYLLAGILTSFLFPLISVHYTVVLPVVRTIQTENAVTGAIQSSSGSIIPYLKLMMLVFYVSGILFVLNSLLRQVRSVIRTIKRSEIITVHPVKLIRTADYTSAFSFFSYVFVNPSITNVETKEIMNHELVHIRQIHWFDLLLGEMLCMLQWFNPLAWIYIRFVRQNHEYLADEVALQRTSDPAIYKAVLLNQIAGFPVVSLANSFNYSLNKKRFNMMKNIISSPYRKMKILFILPVFAIVFYAFARPDYKYNYADADSGNIVSETSLQEKSVKGKVVQNDGTPLPGATIIVKGTTMGTSADTKGGFKLNNVPDDGLLIVSYVGFKPKVLKPVFTSDMIIKMVSDTVKYLNTNISTPPPPPLPEVIIREANTKDVSPPPAPNSFINFRSDGPPPLLVVDGIIMTKSGLDKIPTETIESMNILKDESAIAKYGEKGKDGVIELFSRKATTTLITEYGKKDTIKVTGYGGLHFENNENKAIPLYVLDGVITGIDDLKKTDTRSFELVNILKNEAAITKYGEKGKDGAIEITTKNYNSVGTGNKKPGAKVLWDSSAQSPPPPPPSVLKVGSLEGKTPLIVVDGVVRDIDINKIDPGTFESIMVIKDISAIDKYGEKAKDGAIEITTKKFDSSKTEGKLSEVKVTGYATDQKGVKGKYVVAAELPEFPGGKDAMEAWIVANVRYPGEAVKTKITGKVYVDFMVTSNGKIKNVSVSKSVSPLLDAEAIRVVSSMPDWKPGRQGGKQVAVQIQIPVEFKLK